MFLSLRTALAGRLARRIRWAAVVCCLLLAGRAAVESRLATSRAAASPVAGGVDVVVASRALPTGHRLRPADLTTVHLPRAARPPGSFRSVHRLTGRRLAAPVTAREPLVPPRLLGDGLTTGLPAGTVAMPVVLDSDVSGLVRPGDRVDLLGTPGPDATTDRRAGRAAATLATSVRVLAVSGRAEQEAGGGSRVVLAVSHAQALSITSVRTSDLFTVVARAP